jgi:hypothetical protein
MFVDLPRLFITEFALRVWNFGDEGKARLPDKSDSTFFFAGSVLVFGREQLPL